MEKVRFSQPLFLLQLAGMNPLTTTKFTGILSKVAIFVYATTVILELMELAVNYNGVDSLARASESIFAQYALAFKIAVLMLYRKDLARLIHASYDFWQLDEFGERFAMEFASQHRFVSRFFQLYTANLFVLGTQFILIPILRPDQLPVMMYLNESSPALPAAYVYFVYVLHAVYMFFGCALVAGFDCLFFYFIAHIVSELKMINICFSLPKIPEKAAWTFQDKFRVALKHHIFVMDFATELDRIYSIMLLNQHMCSLFGICFGIFLMTKDGIPPDAHHFTKYTTFIFSYILQIWTYCFAGDQIINWSLKIPDAVFYDNWEDEHSFNNGITKVMIIKRAQKPAKVTLGGFGDLNLPRFSEVMQNAVNFFLFMDTMYHEK